MVLPMPIQYNESPAKPPCPPLLPPIRRFKSVTNLPAVQLQAFKISPVERNERRANKDRERARSPY